MAYLAMLIGAVMMYFGWNSRISKNNKPVGEETTGSVVWTLFRGYGKLMMVLLGGCIILIALMIIIFF